MGAAAIDGALELLEVVDPIFAVIGMVTTVIGWFTPSDTQEILDALKGISDQITNLEKDMTYYFNKLLEAVEQDTCYSQYAQYELTIQQAGRKFQAYQENKYTDEAALYLQPFLDECAGAKCDDAAEAILGAITGESGLFACDMLEILYNGDVNSDYYVGW